MQRGRMQWRDQRYDMHLLLNPFSANTADSKKNLY